MNIRTDFKSILQLDQSELKNYCEEKLKALGYTDIRSNEGYTLALGTIPIVLVAHLDTVHKERPETILYDSEQKMLWSPQGIGGDDRCGVYAILKICEKLKPCVLFTTDEEMGGQGARKFVQNIELKNVKFMIEIDRRGNNQAVFYSCGNKEFQEYILNFGFDSHYGSFSDISVLSPAYDIASVNLSAGYYNEHTKQEYICMSHLYNTINKVIEILEDENSKAYDYQQVKYIYNTSYVDTCYSREDSEWFLRSDWATLSNEQWKKYYGYEKPKTFEEVLKIEAKYYLL